MEKIHIGILPSLLATIGFMIPQAYFWAQGWTSAMFAWSGVVIYLLITGFSNKRWASELDKEAWQSVFKKKLHKIFISDSQKAKL